MTQDPSSNPPTPLSGRGRDLFFGDEPEELAVEAAGAADDTVTTNAEASTSLPVAASTADAIPTSEAALQQEASSGGETATVEEAPADDLPADVIAMIEEPQSPAAAPVTPVDALPVVETDVQPAKPAPQPATPPPPAPAAKSSGNNSGCLQSLAAMLLGALIGVGLTLAILYALNQDLRFAPAATVADAQRTISSLETDASALKENVAGLQGDLSTVQDRATELQDSATTLAAELAKQGEIQVAQGAAVDQLSGGATAMSEQITELQAETQALAGLKDQVLQTQDQVTGLQTTVGTVQQDLGIVAGEVSTLTVRVDDLAISAQRSDRFMQGMRDLMALVYSDEITPTVALTVTPPATPTATFTATTVVTTTATPTATLSVTPTAEITATPTITAGAAITATPTITSTPAITVTPVVTATAPVTAPIATPAPTGTAVPVGQGSIQGSVYRDINRDGRRNPVTEAGVADVRLTLYDRNRVELARAATDSRGNFRFDNLPPGIYVVVESDPSGYVSTSPNILTVVLRNNATASGIDFGDYQPSQ